jgi:hypothetical protein
MIICWVDNFFLEAPPLLAPLTLTALLLMGAVFLLLGFLFLETGTKLLLTFG